VGNGAEALDARCAGADDAFANVNIAVRVQCRAGLHRERYLTIQMQTRIAASE